MPGVKKVTRSPAGRVEALFFKRKDRARSWIMRGFLPRTLRAIRCANVRSGILPPQSGFRRNDEPKGIKMDSGVRRNDKASVRAAAPPAPADAR